MRKLVTWRRGIINQVAVCSSDLQIKGKRGDEKSILLRVRTNATWMSYGDIKWQNESDKLKYLENQPSTVIDNKGGYDYPFRAPQRTSEELMYAQFESSLSSRCYLVKWYIYLHLACL